nr:MAG TPA: hypothetical protein [Caudoviricetes sp.]
MSTSSAQMRRMLLSKLDIVRRLLEAKDSVC